MTDMASCRRRSPAETGMTDLLDWAPKIQILASHCSADCRRLRCLGIRVQISRACAWLHRHGHMSTSNGQVVQGADTHNHVLLIEPEEVVFTNVRINQVQS
jgi:hypothetical protein